MRILVVYGSKRGGTEELAQAVAATLRVSGYKADVSDGRGIEGLQPWDAVIVGGALHKSRWHRHARKFVERNVADLRQRPVWFFSFAGNAMSSSLQNSAQVQALIERAGARGHEIFGDRLAAIRWARSIADELAIEPRRLRLSSSVRVGRAAQRAMALLCLFTGVTALVGGATLVGWRNGASWLGLQLEALHHSPFRDFLIPGILLAGVVGLGNLVAGALVVRRHADRELAAFAAGAAVALWIIGELTMVRPFHWLQLAYLIIGIATMGLAYWRWRDRPRAH
jgi:menaquinone-dependent protoporphyrinogen oxidase